jgi:hypothetical protein
VLLPFQSPRAPELPLNLVSIPPPPEHPERAGHVGEGCANVTGKAAGVPRPFTVTLAISARVAKSRCTGC